MPADTPVEPQPPPRGRLSSTLLPGVLLALLFAAGVVGVGGLVAVFKGSYLSWGIIAIVLGFWCVVALVASLALWVLLLPLLLSASQRLRLTALPVAVLAAGVVAHCLSVRQIVTELDPASAFILNPLFLCAWGLVLSVTAGVIASRPRAGLSAYFLALALVLFCAGIAFFVRPDAAAFVLVIAPVALLALAGALLKRVPSGILLPSAAAACLAALLAVCFAFGELPLRPIDEHFSPDPSKTAMLAGKPNVVIIVLDTVRADHTSLCGYKYPTTPGLESLARDCRFWPNAESVASWTLPAHASLFTGKYPREHGAHETSESSSGAIEKGRQVFASGLAPSHVTLASYLSMKGYNTGAIVANYSWLSRQFGLAQGFSYYYDLPRWLIMRSVSSPVYIRALRWSDALLGRNGTCLRTIWDARAVTEMAQAWLKRSKGAPFFLFLNYNDCHYPYAAPPPFDKVDGPGIPYNPILRQGPWERFYADYINTGKGLTPELLREITSQYDGDIAFADYWVSRLVDTLKKEGLYDSTLLIVTSDHGEFLGEHQLLNHGAGLYEGGLRIPILVKYPGGEGAGEVRPERVSLIDVFATVFDVLKLPLPDVTAKPLGKESHVILAEHFESGMNLALFGNRFRGDQTAIYDASWKYLFSTAGGRELYDLAKDASEDNNLVNSVASVVGALETRINEWNQSVRKFNGRSQSAQKMSDAEWEKLKSLGYTGTDR